MHISLQMTTTTQQQKRIRRTLSNCCYTTCSHHHMLDIATSTITNEYKRGNILLVFCILLIIMTGENRNCSFVSSFQSSFQKQTMTTIYQRTGTSGYMKPFGGWDIENRQLHRKQHAFHMSNSDNDVDIDKKISENDNNHKNNISNDWTWILTPVIPLWLVYISNQWSRYSISYLVDFSSNDPYTAMNIDLHFNQVQYGILASVAFTLLYAITSLFAGFAADKIDRKLLTVISCFVWSLATLGTGLATNYETVIVWRILMGLACAFATPTAYTFIQQTIPTNRIALGSSLYGTGVAIGSGLSSLSILIDTQIGWRQTEILISIVGFIAAIVCALFLPTDPKIIQQKQRQQEKEQWLLSQTEKDDTTTSINVNLQQNDDNKQSSIVSYESTIKDVQTIVSITRVQWIFLASFLRFCAGISIGVWGAPYYRMVFSSYQEQYSITQAAISAIGATTSGIVGGIVADYLSEQKTSNDSTAATTTTTIDDPIGRRLLVPVIGSILAAPAWYLSIHAGIDNTLIDNTFELSMIWLGIEYLVAECWFGPTISSLQATVGTKIAGTAQGLFSLTGAAANSAPALLGYLYSQSLATTSSTTTTSSSEELASLLIGGVCFGYLSSAFCFAMASLAGPTPQKQ